MFDNHTHHSKRNLLRHTQRFALLEADIVIDVHNVTAGQFYEDVVKVPIAKSDDVANHTHHSQGY